MIISQLMQLSQQVQSKMNQLQQDLDKSSVSASSGGGMVVATVDGRGTVREVKIDPVCVDPRDVEMLEDLVLAAVSEAQTQARSAYENEMKKVTGGLAQVPGLSGIAGLP